jgi:hypothetical protein
MTGVVLDDLGDDIAHVILAAAAGRTVPPEIIATLDPFHQQDQWGDLQSRLGPRVASTVIEDTSHALFPEQPTAVARAVIGYLRTLT